jgi:uroporphyrinogen-III synthase
MRVLITRPAEDAERTAAALTAAGHEPLIAPIMVVRGLPHQLQWPVDALVATSANAIRHAQLSPALRTLPVFTVGDTTAAAAREAGFTEVRSAQGDSRDLAKLLQEELKAGSSIAYLAGIPRQDAALNALDGLFHLRAVETYETVAVERLPEAIREGLEAGRIDAVLHFSARSAEVFAELAASALASSKKKPLHAFIAKPACHPDLQPHAVALRPNLAAMIAALEEPP